MDVATSLVQPYLHVNGYFTTTDYPLVEQLMHQPPRALTDVDMLAVRLDEREGGSDGVRKPRVTGPTVPKVDPALNTPPKRTDMIVAEIKKGRARINPASRTRNMLAGALARFGCCPARKAPDLVQTLLQHGQATGDNGHVIRMVLFASQGERAPQGWHWVRLDHVFRFLDEYLRREHKLLGHLDLRDPALAWLSLMRKCGLSIEARESGQ